MEHIANGFWVINMDTKIAELKNKKLTQKVSFEIILNEDESINKVEVKKILEEDFSYIEGVECNYLLNLEKEVKILYAKH